VLAKPASFFWIGSILKKLELLKNGRSISESISRREKKVGVPIPGEKENMWVTILEDGFQ